MSLQQKREQLITQAKAAKLLGISKSSVQKGLSDTAELIPKRIAIGNRFMLKMSDVENLRAKWLQGN